MVPRCRTPFVAAIRDLAASTSSASESKRRDSTLNCVAERGPLRCGLALLRLTEQLKRPSPPSIFTGGGFGPAAASKASKLLDVKSKLRRLFNDPFRLSRVPGSARYESITLTLSA